MVVVDSAVGLTAVLAAAAFVDCMMVVHDNRATMRSGCDRTRALPTISLILIAEYPGSGRHTTRSHVITALPTLYSTGVTDSIA